MFKKLRFIFFTLPLLLFIFIAWSFWSGLKINPQILPSPLINKPVPNFNLTMLMPAKYVNQQIFYGHVTLLNVFATWCETCASEHPFLIDIAQQKIVTIYGLNYKDQRNSTISWLERYGNPYQKVLFDPNGQAAIDWGVYGTPETFLIDSNGIVRYKVTGALTPQIWQKELLPRIKKLQKLATS